MNKILPIINVSATELNNTDNKVINPSTNNLYSINLDKGLKETKDKVSKSQNKNIKTKINNKLRPDEIIHIPDQNLKRALNEELKQSENSNITIKQLESITSLYSSKKIFLIWKDYNIVQI